MNGRRVLVVEDEVIVGMLLEDMLGELGCEVVAISTHLEEALGLARSLDIDFALLDINLDGHHSFPVADVLRERGGPPVTVPGRTGFGSRMIERGLSAELQGDARIDYRPEGVVCTIDAPLAAIRDEAHL